MTDMDMPKDVSEGGGHVKNSIARGNVARARGMSIVATVATIALSVVGADLAMAADRSQITVKDTREFPESITSTKEGAVIFGSISKGIIYRAAPDSATAEPWIQPAS